MVDKRVNKEFRLGVGEAHEFELMGRKTGWTNKDFNRLVQNERLSSSVLSVLRGQSEIKPLDHVIDCSSEPFIPSGWTVENHKKDGQFQWDPVKVSLYRSHKQMYGRQVQGHNLRTELEGQPVLNANVLDYLLAHPELIPEEWKGKYVFFWGTIYRYHDGRLYVRFLCWDGVRWRYRYRWLGRDCDSDSPAAIRAS